MEYKDSLTGEKLRKRFDSSFELVNYAITVAKNLIRSGRAPTVSTEVQNPSFQVLSEIAENREIIQPIEEEEEEKPEGERVVRPPQQPARFNRSLETAS